MIVEIVFGLFLAGIAFVMWVSVYDRVHYPYLSAFLLFLIPICLMLPVYMIYVDADTYAISDSRILSPGWNVKVPWEEFQVFRDRFREYKTYCECQTKDGRAVGVEWRIYYDMTDVNRVATVYRKLGPNYKEIMLNDLFCNHATKWVSERTMNEALYEMAYPMGESLRYGLDSRLYIMGFALDPDESIYAKYKWHDNEDINAWRRNIDSANAPF